MKITPRRLKERLICDATSGDLYWLKRKVRKFTERHNRNDRIWNNRFAGKIAGSINGIRYRVIVLDGQKLLAHRVVWALVNGRWPRLPLDHADRDTLNNSITNLRKASPAQNMQNSKVKSSNKCGLKGAEFDKRDRSWCARIRHDGKRIYLGRFKTASEAHAAYTIASKTHHKEFGRVA